MWYSKIHTVSMGMYDYEDVINELWERIYMLLKRGSYDFTKSSMTTWLYMVCPQQLDRIWRIQNMQIRYPGDKKAPTSLYSVIGEDKDSYLIDFIIDPQGAFEDKIVQDDWVYDCVYLSKLLIDQLQERERIIYMHSIKGLTLEQSAIVFGITKERIRQIRLKLHRRIIVLKKKINQGKLDHKKAMEFAYALLDDKDDEEISEIYGYDFATVRISREILSIAGLYEGR
jgi:RNA polymerase sigma factor (sigma-70 family)